MSQLEDILKSIERGEISAQDALNSISPQEIDLGFARLDIERAARRGLAEVVFAPGKTNDQLLLIAEAMVCAEHPFFATRVNSEQVNIILKNFPDAVYHKEANALTIDTEPLPEPKGQVAVVCAGSSDIPVAEEAALTARRMGAHIERIYDVGVAGLHRLLNRISVIRKSRAVVVVAGMEGALPSVVGGLIHRPIIAVPTSVGYGASFNGLSSLLTMLNSCVPGITVVNIDNGYGAGVAAAMINRTGEA